MFAHTKLNAINEATDEERSPIHIQNIRKNFARIIEIFYVPENKHDIPK